MAHVLSVDFMHHIRCDIGMPPEGQVEELLVSQEGPCHHISLSVRSHAVEHLVAMSTGLSLVDTYRNVTVSVGSSVRLTLAHSELTS